jgi:hypothetical protein
MYAHVTRRHIQQERSFLLLRDQLGSHKSLNVEGVKHFPERMAIFESHKSANLQYHHSDQADSTKGIWMSD